MDERGRGTANARVRSNGHLPTTVSGRVDQKRRGLSWGRITMQSHGMNLAPTVMRAIQSEYTRAHMKHRGWTPKSDKMGDGERLAILVEEIGEVARAVTYDNSNIENLIAELIQVSAMAGAWAEYAMRERDRRVSGQADHSRENGIRVRKEFGPESVD